MYVSECKLSIGCDLIVLYLLYYSVALDSCISLGLHSRIRVLVLGFPQLEWRLLNLHGRCQSIILLIHYSKVLTCPTRDA